MNTEPDNVFECMGGPLCGSNAEDTNDIGRFAYRDDDGKTHFYRLVRIESKDGKAGYTFFHYFGTSPKRALKAPPVFVPYKRLARAKRRK